jgi:hypothetical protein
MKGNIDHKWTDEITAAAGQTSLPIIIPGWVNELTAIAIPGGGGTCNVQHTVAAQELVESNPNGQQWVNWDPGSVSVATSQAARGPVTAVRISAVTQPATLQVAAQRRRT